MIHPVIFLLVMMSLLLSPSPVSSQNDTGKNQASISELEDQLFFTLSNLQRLKSRYKSGKIEEAKYKKKLKRIYKRMGKINKKMILTYYQFSDSAALPAQEEIALPEKQQQSPGNAAASTSLSGQQNDATSSQQQQTTKAEESSSSNAVTDNPQQSKSFLYENLIWISLGAIGLVLLLLLGYFFLLTKTLAGHLKYVSEEVNKKGERSSDMDEMERKLERLTGTLRYMASDLSKMRTPVLRLEAPGWSSPAQQPAASHGAAEEVDSHVAETDEQENDDSEKEAAWQQQTSTSFAKDDPESSQGHASSNSRKRDDDQSAKTNEQEVDDIDLEKDIPKPPKDTDEGKELAEDMEELGKLKDQYIDKIFLINNLSVEANSLLNSIRKNKLTPASKQAAEKKLQEINEQMRRLIKE